MRRIALPPSRWETIGGPALIGALSLAAATAPVVPAWRWTVPLAVLIVGGWQLWRYLRRRPQAATISADGHLMFLQDGGRVFPVSEVRIGSINPTLLAARCGSANGEVLDVFLPGSVIDRETHRLLRKALLALPADSRQIATQSAAGRGK